tara:strand:+ start:276 stop:515 length:240 start_codon:yes stop_codon:yes gene_type:complete
MKYIRLLPLVLILTLFNTNSYAEDCDSIKMNSSANIIKKLKCKAGSDTSSSSTSAESSEKKDGILGKIWKRPEWTKKNN